MCVETSCKLINNTKCLNCVVACFAGNIVLTNTRNLLHATG